MGYLIVFTFLLTILTSFAVVLLIIRQNRFADLENKYKKLQQELEETLSMFFVQMKDENDAFLKMLHQVLNESGKQKQKRDSVDGLNTNHDQDEIPSIYINRVEEQETTRNPMSIPNYSGIKQYQKSQNEFSKEQENHPDQVESENEQPITEQDNERVTIKQLLEKGISIEEIAKSLNKGKTEIELLIKFSPELANLRNLHKNHENQV